jgi:hypothetical protein
VIDKARLKGDGNICFCTLASNSKNGESTRDHSLHCLQRCRRHRANRRCRRTHMLRGQVEQAQGNSNRQTTTPTDARRRQSVMMMDDGWWGNRAIIMI